MTLKESVNNLLPQSFDDEDIGLPDDSDWFGDNAMVIAMRTENPAVKACLYDRNKKEMNDEVDFNLQPSQKEISNYSTDYLSDIMEFFNKLSGEVEITMEKDQPIRIESEDSENRKTIVLLAPRIE